MTQVAPNSHLTQNSTHPNFAGKDDRNFGAWTITTDAWSTKGAVIVLPINPESLEIGMRIRSSEVAMKGGKFFAVSRNPRTGSVFEFPSIAFKFNSGNIQPVFSTDFIKGIQSRDKIVTKVNSVVAEPTKPSSGNVGNHIYGRYASISAKSGHKNKAGKYVSGSKVPGMYSKHPNVPVGIQNLYAMINMLQDSWMFQKNEPGYDGASVPFSVLNRVIIHTTSLAFPNLALYGFVDESGLQWEESVDNFNNFDLSFNLVVTHTMPNLSCPSIESMVRQYKAGTYGSKAPKGVWTDHPDATPAENPTEPVEDADYGDVESAINSAANDVAASMSTKDPAVASATKDPKELTLADRIRAYVGDKVSSAKEQVDYYAEKAKVKVDAEYAAKKSNAQRTIDDAARFNPSIKSVTDAPAYNPNKVA